MDLFMHGLRNGFSLTQGFKRKNKKCKTTAGTKPTAAFRATLTQDSYQGRQMNYFPPLGSFLKDVY